MKCASKKVGLSFICERAPARLQPTMPRRSRSSRSVSGYDSQSISTSGASIEGGFMSAIIQANPLEKLSQERLPTGDSCVLIIFGASGDLTNRKLIPGLYNLACEGCMNPQFEVLGIGRTPMSSEEFRKKTGEAAAKSKDTRHFSETGREDFEQRLHDMVDDIQHPTFYSRLRVRL